MKQIHKIKRKDCNCFLEYESVNDNSINYKRSSYNKNYSKKIDENLKNWFKYKNTFEFPKKINWEEFNDESLSEKEEYGFRLCKKVRKEFVKILNILKVIHY